MAKRRWRLDAVRTLALLGAGALHFAQLAALIEMWGTERFSNRDFRVFHVTSEHFVSGRAEQIYAPVTESFPFLHPPIVIVLTAPLAAIPLSWTYFVFVLAQVAFLVLAVVALRRLSAENRLEHDVVWLAVLTSAPWSISLALGQPSALPLALWLLAFYALARERPMAAGALFALCALKPTFLIAPFGYLLITRDRRALGGFAVTLAVLAGLSLLAGPARWGEWLVALGRLGDAMVRSDLPLWKQHTWFAFLRSIAPARVAWILWVLACPLGIVALLRAAGAKELGALRVAAPLALATIALSPYAYYYDALLLAIPAASLWLARKSYGPFHSAMVLVATATFFWQHLGFLVFQRGPALGGLLVLGWLVLELSARGPVLPGRSPLSRSELRPML